MTISIYEIAALGAAALWAFGSIFGSIAVRHMGTFAFNRVRLLIAPIFLLGLFLLRGGETGITMDGVSLILLSGIVGIFLGDAVLFASVRRLGPRRTAVLFATNAPMTALLGAWILGENLSTIVWTGIGIVVAGVILAIVFGKRKSQLSEWEDITPPLWIGVMLGLGGALGQAVGSIIVRPVLENGADPVFVALLRVAIAGAAFWALYFVAPRKTRLLKPMTPHIWRMITLATVFGMVIGLSLIMFAFSGAEAGIVATLSATTPVILLPILWYTTREVPALGAWIGAALVVVGSGFIFLG